METTKQKSARKTTLYIKKLVYSALFLAIAMVLPLVTGQIPEIGQMLSPMHLPVLLCGFVCGWPWGLAVGFIAPGLRFLIFGMPPIFPTGVAMMFELAVYGAIAGLLYAKLPKKTWLIWAELVGAMVVGRLVWGAVQFIIAGLQNTSFDLTMFWAGAIAGSIPGIIAQLVIVPLLVIVFRKAKLMLNE